MIKSLGLKNFRQHLDLQVLFTAGLNTILGLNESGKSSILEAVFYGLLGTDMLRESISEVVSYDKPVNTLRVDLALCIDGMDYTIYRSPTGAEIVYADQRVTGQRATKQFMENLLGCDAALIKRLIFAKQDSVKGVIDSDDKAAAGSMVEKLADLQLIDDIVQRIQTHLPSGNTKVLAGQLEQLTASRGIAPELPKKEAVSEAAEELALTSAHCEKLKPNLAEFTTKSVTLKAQLARAAEVLISKSAAEKRMAELQKQAVNPAELDFTQADLDNARKLAFDLQGVKRARLAKAAVFPTTELEWEGTEASFLKAIDVEVLKLARLATQRSDLRERRVASAAMAINEDLCSFCKKDISQLPEVAEVNSKVKAALMEIDSDLAMVTHMQVEATLMRDTLMKLKKVCDNIKKLAVPEFWSLSDTVPPVPTWIGGDLPPEGEAPNVKAMEAELAAYTSRMATAKLAREQLEGMDIPVVPDTAAMEAELVEVEEVIDQIKAEFDKLTYWQQTVNAAENQYVNDMKLYDLQAKHFADQEAQITKLTASIGEAEKHNTLIKKLRDTRPAIAAELWTIVLGGISHYFTQIRGTESLVTRDADGFRVNGRSVAGLSGSTQDALGLAVRVALTRTFLPSIPFLVLDEPFHGCDKAREVAGLGLLACTGFEQTLLVTHSDLADSLSDNLLTL